jgi:hypothetical protein
MDRKIDSVIPDAAPTITPDDPPAFKTPSYTLAWSDDPEAKLRYALKPETAYVIYLRRGKVLAGAQILGAFQPIAAGRKIKVIDVDFGSVGFWEKMMERKLVHDWGMENPKILL